MKILFYSHMGLAPLHLGMELELIENLKKEGHDIYIIRCENQLNSCFFNPCHNLIGCAICKTRAKKFHQYLGIDPKHIFLLKDMLQGKKIRMPTFNSLETLLGWYYEGINIGRGVASSVISLERDYNIDNNKRQKELIEHQALTAINALLNFKLFLQEIKPDYVYLFNGRFAEQFPLIELCQLHKIPFSTYECGATYQKYQIYEQALPHSIMENHRIMMRLWEENTKSNKIEIAQNWFNTKRNGTNKHRFNFLKNQKKGNLPADFNQSKRNIVIFNSSEDEMKVIEEWKTELYTHQNEAIRTIVAYFQKKQPDFHFYIRMHPNLAKVDNLQTKELYALEFNNITLIKPTEVVDSFALVENCEKIITFGSTIGIEATFWNKTSILLGRAFYEKLDATYVPTSYEELFSLLTTVDLPPKSKESTYPYGHFITKYGAPFKHFDYKNKSDSTFKHFPVKRIYLATIINLIKMLPKLPIWFKLNKVVLNRRLGFKDIFRLKSHTIE